MQLAHDDSTLLVVLSSLVVQYSIGYRPEVNLTVTAFQVFDGETFSGALLMHRSKFMVLSNLGLSYLNVDNGLQREAISLAPYVNYISTTYQMATFQDRFLYFPAHHSVEV